MVIDGIEKDPAWNGGNYVEAAPSGTSSCAIHPVHRCQRPLRPPTEIYPTREAAKAYVEERVESGMGKSTPTMIYQSRTYNPWTSLEKIRVPLTYR